jgi:hypothetical protein
MVLKWVWKEKQVSKNEAENGRPWRRVPMKWPWMLVYESCGIACGSRGEGFSAGLAGAASGGYVWP